MRQTKQNTLILDIVNNSYNHPTAYDIYLICKNKIPNISLGTVYRNLNNLVESGKILRIKMPNNIDRYDKIYNKHAHFICIKCNKIIDIFDKFNIDSSVNFTIPIYVFLSNFYSDISIPPIYKTMNQSIHLTTCRCIIFSDFIIYIICKFFVSTKHTNI